MKVRYFLYIAFACLVSCGLTACWEDTPSDGGQGGGGGGGGEVLPPEQKVFVASLLNGSNQDAIQGDTLPLRVIVRNGTDVSYSWKRGGKEVSADSIYRFVSKTVGTETMQVAVNSNEGDTLISFTINVYPDYRPVSGLDDIELWAGEGERRAALIVQWMRGTDWDTPLKSNVHVLCWGYRWKADVSPTGQDMIKAVAKADKRLFVMLGRGFGSVEGNKNSIQGFGYDGNGDGKFTIRNTKTGKVYTATDFTDGVVELPGDETGDNYVSDDPADFWAGGWLLNYWSYWLGSKQSTTIPTKFDYSQLMADLRPLVDNTWDAWTFSSINDGHVNTYVFYEWAVAAGSERE